MRDDGETLRIGRIVEVEAYVGEEDAASHARFGRTARNGVMYGVPGTAYVYLVYGMHHCLNVVTEPVDRPAAVLIRAVEPVLGVDALRGAREGAAARRGRHAPSVADARLASGPALVCEAFGIDRADTGRDLCEPGAPLRLELPSAPATEPVVAAGPRIGIAYAAEPWRSHPWRLFDPASPSISVRPRG